MQDYTLIFDLDGTLANTRPDLLEALNHSIEPEGLAPLQFSDIGYLFGQGSLAMIKCAFEHHNIEADSDLELKCQKRFLSFYEDNISNKTHLFEGAQKALDDLQAFTLSVCTNKPEYLARKLLTEIGIIEKFASLTGGDTYEFRKPDARHLTNTVELANGTKAKAIMIGDTITDTKAAQNAGIPVIVVDFGYSNEPVDTLNANVIISHFDELLPAINQLIATN